MGFSVFEETVNWAKKNRLSHSAFAKTASTNDTAKNEAMSLHEDFKLYIADEQTAGRGRGGNSWANPAKGTALMSTWSFKVSSSPQAISGPLIGLAIYEALQRSFSDKNFSIKAPNDIFLKDKKILGILVETIKQGSAQRLIIGLGLNVFSSPDEVATAGCLTAEMKNVTWAIFLDNLYACLRVAALSVSDSILSEKARADLLVALNRHPLLSSPYSSVSPFGDLASPDGVQSWQNI
jgi:BirA family transcriptional regulator, biotin operon repressor / biotin---[acetyl-CoA-carboxylase] ligase